MRGAGQEGKVEEVAEMEIEKVGRILGVYGRRTFLGRGLSVRLSVEVFDLEPNLDLSLGVNV